MTFLQPRQLIELFPLFDESLSTFIHQHGEDRTFEVGEELMRPGQFFKYAVLIVGGKVKLYREGNEGEEFFMYFLEAGEACALSMMCMARNQASTVTAIASETNQCSNDSHPTDGYHDEILSILVSFCDRNLSKKVRRNVNGSRPDSI